MCDFDTPVDGRLNWLVVLSVLATAETFAITIPTSSWHGPSPRVPVDREQVVELKLALPCLDSLGDADDEWLDEGALETAPGAIKEYWARMRYSK